MRAMFTRRLARPAVMAMTLSLAALAGTAAQAAPLPPGSPAASAIRTTAGSTPPAGYTAPCPTETTTDASCPIMISTQGTSGASNSVARDASATTTPEGLSPSELQQAYGFQSAAGGSGQTVAVVTPYNDTDLASDLAAYRSQYGMTPCTVANGCLEVASETGSTTSLPGTSSAWIAPVAESTDMISAICPNCHILVVEASTATMTDLGPAENEAVTLGATAIDNNWSVTESSGETTYDTEYFGHPGVAITAPAGDSGYGVIAYPAASQYVTAAGGTVLTADSSPRGYTESAWADSGSGCSEYEPKPSWQTDTGCSGRTLNDISADAGTDVAFYDTPDEAGWGTAVGTDVASAIVAAAYALAGTPASGTYPAEYPYEYPGGSYTTPGNAYPYADGLNDITTGSDGTCSVAYLCTAGTGYNGPTGLGTPSTDLALSATGEESGAFFSGVEGYCMDNTGNATTAGNKVQLWTCDGENSQAWTAEPNGTITTNGDYCLDVADSGTSAGTLAELNPCASGTESQQWTPQANGEVINAASGLCLEDPGTSTTDGTQLDIDTCNNSSKDQQWAVPYDRPSGSGAITSKITTASLCVDDDNSGTANGNKIQIWQCLSDAAQNWTVEPGGTIQDFGGCLTADDDGTTNATPIVLWQCTGDPSQAWTEQADGSLINVRSGLCLADPDANTTNGTQLQLSPCSNEAQQTWTLP